MGEKTDAVGKRIGEAQDGFFGDKIHRDAETVSVWARADQASGAEWIRRSTGKEIAAWCALLIFVPLCYQKKLKRYQRWLVME